MLPGSELTGAWRPSLLFASSFELIFLRPSEAVFGASKPGSTRAAIHNSPVSITGP